MKNIIRIKAETKEEQVKVLKIFEKEGYLWRSLQKPTKFIPIHRYGKKYVYIEADTEFKKLATIDEEYKKPSVEENTFGEFLARHTKVIL